MFRTRNLEFGERMPGPLQLLHVDVPVSIPSNNTTPMRQVPVENNASCADLCDSTNWLTRYVNCCVCTVV